jgi:hypothetical protein
MSTYHYLIALGGAEYVELGKKKADGSFDGPSCIVRGGLYFLPKDLLGVLVNNFKSAHVGEDVRIVDESEFDRCVGDNFIAVGGDRDIDIDIWKYLPRTQEVEEHIVAAGRLIAKKKEE